MDMSTIRPVPKPSFLTRLLCKIAAADLETLELCPPGDWDCIRAVAWILLFTWCYQMALFSIIGHRVFAEPGQLRPSLVIAAFFLASFVLSVDRFMVIMSGWFASGVEQLKRGGIDISGGIGPRVKAIFFLGIRIFLSIGIAQLTAIFLSLLIFGSDISARIHDRYLQANAALISSATALVDGQIKRATDAVKAEGDRETALAGQVTTLRQNQVDPSASDPQMQLAQQELTRLLAQKADADQAVERAEAFASNELGGIQAPGNTGIPGDGPRRRAAMESVTNAKEEDRQVSAALETARSRFNDLRTQWMSTSQTAKQQSRGQSPAFETALAKEDERLSSMKDQLASLTNTRDDAIRSAVVAAPDYVPVSNGLLTQIIELDHIAHENPRIAAVIILIDLSSFAFELAAVLAKVTSYVPTTYAALIARDAYMSTVRIVNGMMAELNGAPEKQQHEDEFVPQREPESEAPSEASEMDDADPFAGVANTPIVTPKRPRGRPPKVQPNGKDNDPVPARVGTGSDEF